MNQDYAFGHAVADDFKKVMAKEIPDLRLLGVDFAPIGHKDFGPYISKILASGAEIIYTGNFGIDLSNFIKQGAQMGIKARYATYFMDDNVYLPDIGQACRWKLCKQHLPADDRHPTEQSFCGPVA